MTILPKKLLAAAAHRRGRAHGRGRLSEAIRLDPAGVYALLGTSAAGLSQGEAARRLGERGRNVLAKDRSPSLWTLLWRALRDPLVVLLAALATIAILTGDRRSGAVMGSMIALSVVLKLAQESKANRAAASLKAMVSVSATVVRGGEALELPVAEVVPGDLVHLSAGDMVPGDVRVLEAKDLFIVQSALTGEGFPVEKFAVESTPAGSLPLEWTSAAYLGTSVASGTAVAVIAATGQDTYLGGVAASLATPAAPTAFDRSIARYAKLMLAFMAVMVPAVFVINGVTRGAWGEAFFFALAVAVGLTPEMLPMIVTACLAKGAVAMGRKKVIVKRIAAIQDLGAMDVLCTDKTGTLTENQIVLERYCSVTLCEDEHVLALAYVNSHFQTGLKSILDRAVLAHERSHAHARVPELTKVDEIPFDFERRLMSIVVRTPEGKDRLIAKGAPETVFDRCGSFRLDGSIRPMDSLHIEQLEAEHERLSRDGFRVLAVATRELEPRGGAGHGATPYGKADERELILEGYVAFLDPPKESAAGAIEALQRRGIDVKVITGDSDLVARKVCHDVGLSTERTLLGTAIEAMSASELEAVVEETSLFARVSPAHKQRIVRALQARGHTVGFMGDGINDAPALHAADVSISVDTAVDIAKDSADLILLERSLLVVDEGVLEGRRVFANILKYIRMGASSSFGNALSVVGASFFVPFLPMRPIQILANNLLYDVGQTAIPTDTVDAEHLEKPRVWDLRGLTRFILVLGPCSSVFDYLTFMVLLYGFGCWDVSTPARAAHSQALFQTGWFIESLVTQTLIVHVIRTSKIPWVQSRASRLMTALTIAIMAIGISLPFTPIASSLGLTPPPGLYWPLLGLTLLGYVSLTQLVKSWLVKRGLL
jgi:Mg2+-importing ATPase